ncbi:MAG: hypothetical protein Q6354_06295 [Candidatus Brocadiales bacterium]|nr:hypothetical protein [Candidatus Brocadiales bacterium]
MLVKPEKVYRDKEDIEEFNRASEIVARKRSAISFIFECSFLSEIAARRGKIKALESVAGMLTELTKEQIKIFEEAVRRRPLFG